MMHGQTGTCMVTVRKHFCHKFWITPPSRLRNEWKNSRILGVGNEFHWLSTGSGNRWFKTSGSVNARNVFTIKWQYRGTNEFSFESVTGGITFIGMMVGSVVWGNLSDRMGRRRTVLSALGVNAVFSVIAAFMPTYGTFMTARFCSAVGWVEKVQSVRSSWVQILQMRSGLHHTRLSRTNLLHG